MSRPAPRTLEVLHSRHLTPHMLRVTLGGPGLASFPRDQESAYIKLVFPRPGQERPLLRTYTVSRQRDNEIDVDFALHATHGAATDWALKARAGDHILVGGPGPKKLVNTDADWFLLVGDMTALPAISVNLAGLPQGARGFVVIEVPSESDIQALPSPEHMAVHWLVNATPDPEGGALLARVEQLPWLPGRAAVWAACEFNSMRALRQYFKHTRQVPKSHLYISSYWKIGSTEDQHKIEKRDDAEAMEPGLPVASGGTLA